MGFRNEDPFMIGQNYFYGDGVRKNCRKTFPYLLAAAQDNIAHAQNLVGYCYNLGLGVEKDLIQAA